MQQKFYSRNLLPNDCLRQVSRLVQVFDEPSRLLSSGIVEYQTIPNLRLRVQFRLSEFPIKIIVDRHVITKDAAI